MSGLFVLLPEAVLVARADSKDVILDMLAAQFAKVYGLDHQTVLARITDRENLGSTGFGRHIAIPHARMTGLKRPVSVFMRLETTVEFDSADGLPVNLIFGLLSPEGAGATHLHALAAISRMLRDDRMRESLVAAPGAEALYGLLSNVIDRDAA